MTPHRWILRAVVLAAITLAAPAPAPAQGSGPAASPAGLLKARLPDGQTLELPLKATAYQVEVSGTHAHVELRQGLPVMGQLAMGIFLEGCFQRRQSIGRLSSLDQAYSVVEGFGSSDRGGAILVAKIVSSDQPGGE